MVVVVAGAALVPSPAHPLPSPSTPRYAPATCAPCARAQQGVARRCWCVAARWRGVGSLSTTRAWGVRGTPGGGSATAAACSSRSKASSWSNSGQVGFTVCTPICMGVGMGGGGDEARRGLDRLVCGSFVFFDWPCEAVTPTSHGLCAGKCGLDAVHPHRITRPAPTRHFLYLSDVRVLRARRGSPGAAGGVRPVSCKVHACGTCGVVVCVYPALVGESNACAYS